MNSSSEIPLNSAETPSSCTPNLGFFLIAGALAGLLFAAEVNSLQPLVWSVGVEGTTALLMMRLIGSLVEITAVRSLCLLGAGLAGGFLAAILLPHVGPRIRRSSRAFLLLLWVLASFLWVFSDDFPAFGMGRGLAALAIVLAGAFAAYFIWRVMLQWLNHQRIGRTILAIAATTFTFWVLFLTQVVLR